MSFASDIKKELTTVDVDGCCKHAELAALIRMNGAISLSNQIYMLDIQTENAAIARRIYSLLKSLYDLPIELLVRKKMKLKKNNVYIVRLKHRVESLLTDLDILKKPHTFIHSISDKYVSEIHCKRSYLRGAFLAGGSINNPE
ncbi:MAG TPA: DNA-binding protein WhiA, partial [Bacillota bacterium]|nr:DNA-binding protein WhiA [Bacillota bacterium]